jgi:hypothetical protein
MNIIKLGRNTYRAYGTLYAMSYLFYIKNGTIILKRIDGPASFYKLGPTMKDAFVEEARAYMADYLSRNAQAWEIQGEVLASLV